MGLKLPSWWCSGTGSRLLPLPDCLFCDLPVSGSTPHTGAAACNSCLASLPWVDPEQPGEWGETSALYYRSPVRELVLAAKRGQGLQQLYLLAELTRIGLQPRLQERPQAIIPVPLHPERLRSRGYNQALELVRPLARALALPVLPHAVLRTHRTRDQKSLSAQARQHNMQAAFRLPAALPLQHVAIFDDVITTGVTCHALRKTLLDGGIRRVDIWTCATTKY
ncbi:MAG: ComF family protein [Thiothrix sp.]|nr:ComF family protein [Thiothrix sp.]HPQ96241.1 ComF family protein [Thiolinea sp.]